MHVLRPVTRFFTAVAFLATLFIVDSMSAKAALSNITQNVVSNVEKPTGVMCPRDTLFEPYTKVCAPVNDITHLFKPSAAVSGADPSTLDDLPVPGGTGAGTNYRLGTHQALDQAVFHTKMFIQPEGLDSIAQDWQLLTPATNHTDSATEFVGIYASHLEQGWFGIFGRPCTEEYPCPDGDTSNGWQAGWSWPFSEFECNITEIVDQGGHLQKVMHYANETVKLDQEDPPLWQNAIYLWNYCMDEWDLYWRHQYRENKRDCSIVGCYRWGPILETFGTQAEINELGYEDSLLFHDGQWSLLPPDETDFVPSISPWQLLHLDPNRGYGVGNRAIPAPIPKEDLLIDFGMSGLWAWMNDNSWRGLNAGSPQRVVAGNLDGITEDDVIADFASSGIWVYRNLVTWSKLHASASEKLVVGDLDGNDRDDLIVDFGAAALWVYMNDNRWLQLNSSSPDDVVTGDIDGNNADDVIGDFGAGGIWTKRNQGAWIKLHPIGPEMMAVGDLDDNGRDDVLVDFGVDGLWVYMNDTNWVKQLSSSPDLIAAGDVDGNGADDILASFALSGDGLWQKLNLSTWSQLHTNATDQIVTGDVDGSGKDDIIASFTSTAPGIFIKRNQAPWVLLNGQSPESLAVGNLDGQ